MRQFRRHFDVEFRVQIAQSTPMHFGQALAAQTEYLAGRRARRDLQHGVAFEGRHLHFAAQGRAGKADRHAAKQIGAFALKNLMRLDMQNDVEISGLTAPRTAFALAGGAQPRAVLDARRNLDLDLGRLFHAPLAVADVAWLFDGLPRAPAAGTRLRNIEKAARHGHLPVPAAGLAGRDLAARFRAAAMAGIARLEL